ncbi:MAG: MFS transporter [Lachnospiraceae bacterium]|nr:MFS transporter [Lachnospiraceae bacterium]
MEEKKYLKWYNKVGYGSGDIAGNVVYAFLSAFVMIYLTNCVGLNAGIVGTLIAVSKLMDGVTDVFFGTMIDRTKTKLGKARPWMLYGYIGCAVTLAAIFAIPESLGETAQYAWFFIAYTLLNAVFYTANNIAYSALTSLITKNSKERVEMGSLRFIFAFSTSLLIQSVTLYFVQAAGGGMKGWRTVAIIYSIIGLVINTISALSVKELSEEELREGEEIDAAEEKITLLESAKLLFTNKFYVMICGTYLLQQIYQAMINTGLYYMIYILMNENLFPAFSWATNIPVIIALVITPTLVEKWGGMYKLNMTGFIIATVGRALVVVAASMGSVPLMLAFTAVAAAGIGPWQGDMNAVIALCSEYTYLTKNKRIDGAMYSCTSFGVKVGGGIGTALTGWMLAYSGFDGKAAVQPESCLEMLKFMYLILPVIIMAIIAFIMSRMNVEKANAKLREKL